MLALNINFKFRPDYIFLFSHVRAIRLRAKKLLFHQENGAYLRRNPYIDFTTSPVKRLSKLFLEGELLFILLE